MSFANLGGVEDPRGTDDVDYLGTKDEHRGSISHDVAAPDTHGHNTIYLDSSIGFEDYHYWADRSREYEKHIQTESLGLQGVFKLLIGKKSKPADPVIVGEPENAVAGSNSSNSSNKGEKEIAEKQGTDDATRRPSRPDQWGVMETEWETAQRATRTATWGSVFYLITTDILGPTNVPWAISQMGYGVGFALYTSFGLMAAYSGFQLWKMFCGLDSTRYPMRNYGDLAFRVYGKYTRIGFNILQSFQFFLNIVLLIESNGQGLAQMAVGANGNGYLCFIVAEVIFMLLGWLLGQIRTLQRLSWLANFAIWLNVIVIIMTMAVVHEYPPNYSASFNTYGTERAPIHTTSYWPPDVTLMNRVNGLMNCVFAYGGATLFNELMAEMRRPFDFWKSFLCAEIFIYCCYLLMGMVVYSAQGQFTYNPAYQGIPQSAYRFQTVGNALSWISGMIAALLYGNIGIKVFYSAVLRDVFRFPPLDKTKGKWTWVALVPIYWGLAFVIAAAIPQISNLTSFVGAACILQFSYTFPPMLSIGYRCQKDSMLPEEHFDPRTGQAKRVDQGFKRWMRGYRKQLALNVFDSFYSVAALATAGLGIWASVIGMHDTFSQTSITPFTCKNPAG